MSEKKIMGMDKPNGFMEDLAQDIGYTAATALLDWFGGTSLWVPSEHSENHVIERVIGVSAFRQLIRVYGHKTLNLPLDYRREISRRNRMIGALILKGVKPAEIARIALMTERQVHYVRVSLEQAGLLPYILGSESYSQYLRQIENNVDYAEGSTALIPVPPFNDLG